MANKTDGLDKLKGSGQELLKNLGDKAMDTVNDKLGGLTDKLTDIGEGGPIGKAAAKAGEASAKGDNPVLGRAEGRRVRDQGQDHRWWRRQERRWRQGHQVHQHRRDDRRGRAGQGRLQPVDRVRRLPELHEEGRERRGAGRQQDQLQGADLPESHRTWEATILEQIPDERIVWRSKGQKGHVDGAVTFHEIGPNLTRILVVLEYYPQGLFEKTGNIWEAQGRRARAEVRHFRRHVMTRTILNPDEVEGWRGRIEDGEVVETHEDALEREEQEQQEAEDSEYDE